ncbi:FMR1N protein, partial [Turnix velox]|nr:FMR1N protein [Turnix velox]
MLLTGTYLAWNCVVLVLLYSTSSSFASPTEHVLEKSEVAPRSFSMNLQDVYEALFSFFRPVTCKHKDQATLIPCHVGESLNKTECLQSNCCPSKGSHEPLCYMPFADNTTLTFRVLLIVAGGLLLLGCLPLCCCAGLQR